MKPSPTLLLLPVLLLPAPCFAADPAPACLEDKIAVQKLTQQNAQLMQQIMQLQFPTIQQAGEAAKKEEERLNALLPKPDKPKK